jgi:putative Ca2+/H+ antiporter (TMEM165/GDT1 family)
MPEFISPDAYAITFSTFSLIMVAEIGDKSQLVIIALAARHRHWPVLFGSVVAFIVLNLLAVIFGATIAQLIPEWFVAALVAILFGFFGLHVLLTHDGEESEEISTKPGHGIFLTTLLLLFMAEFGDKTQIAVAGLASTYQPVPVWIGATTALIAVSALGVWAGRTIFQRISKKWVSRFGGLLFLVFSLIAAWKSITIL